MEIALVIVAGLFAVFCGLNDGGTLLVTSLKLTSLRPISVVLILAAMVVVVPVLLGTGVATTLAGRLVSFQDAGGRMALLVAVIAACSVVMILATRGVPTSLTVALIGGIVGAGLGGRLPIAWSWVAAVMLVAAVAPLIAMVAAFAVVHLWAWSPLPGGVERQVRHAHRLGVAAQAVAYGSNDGQKMLAVFTLALPTAGVTGNRITVTPWVLSATGVLFCAGTLAGARRYGVRLGTGVLPLTPVHAATAQLSSAVVVAGSAAIGAPVSMTQAITGALVGSGLRHGTGRIRWRHVLGIVAAWLLTLPLTGFLSAAAMAVVLRT